MKNYTQKLTAVQLLNIIKSRWHMKILHPGPLKYYFLCFSTTWKPDWS